MKIRNKIIIGAAAVAAVLVGGTAAAQADPLDGYECQSVYSGGGWISFCTYVGTGPEVDSVQRIAGANRYETSALLSQVSFEPGVPVVYIANGVTLVDALGAGAAAQGAGPVLAVPRDGVLPTATANELARLDPASIVIVGDPRSVSESMAAQVTEAAAR